MALTPQPLRIALSYAVRGNLQEVFRFVINCERQHEAFPPLSGASMSQKRGVREKVTDVRGVSG